MTPDPTSPSPRPFLEKLEAYVPGEQPRGGGWVKLNTTEFPYPAAPQVIEAIRREAADTVRVYRPDPRPPCAKNSPERNGVEADPGPRRQRLGCNPAPDRARWLGPDRPLAMVLPPTRSTRCLPRNSARRSNIIASSFRAPAGSCSRQMGGPASCPRPTAARDGVSDRGTGKKLAATGGLLVLDGAYIDFAPGYNRWRR